MKETIVRRSLEIVAWAKAHRILAGVGLVATVLMLFGVYSYFTADATPTSYVLGTVTRGDLVLKVKGTGQVSAENQVDLKPQGSTQSSATVERVYVVQGQRVSAGQLIASIQNQNALTSLRQAQASVQSAQANYDKVVKGATEQSLAVSEASVASSKVALNNAEQSLINKMITVYNDAYSVIYTNTNPLFTNPNSETPRYGLFGTSASTVSYSSNTQLVTNISNQRAGLNALVPIWGAEVMNTTTTDDLTLRAQHTREHLQTVLTYLNDILNDLTNYQNNQSAVATYIASINGARSTIINDLSSLLSAGAGSCFRARITQSKPNVLCADGISLAP